MAGQGKTWKLREGQGMKRQRLEGWQKSAVRKNMGMEVRDRAGQGEVGQGKARQDRARHRYTGQGRARQDRAGQGRAGQDRAR
jgi:hypothetical protein